MHSISLSVFFPCYNEEKNIENLVLKTIHVLDNLVKEYEILIINDGSADSTGIIAERLSMQYDPVRVVHHAKNRGYGAALISGFANSVHDWIFFTDGDHQFHMKEIDLLLAGIDDCDAIIGFRKVRKDPWQRIVYARAWNMLIRLCFGLKVKDLNCAFKLIKKKAVKHIALRSSGALINTELLLRLKASGVRIREVGVSHKPRLFGKQTGGNPRVILRAFYELIRLFREQRLSRPGVN